MATAMADRPPPSTAAIAIATAIIAALGGYLLGQGSSLGLFSSASSKKSWPNSYDVTIHPDSSDEELMKTLRPEKAEISSEASDDEEEQGELKSFDGDKEECKLVLVVRTDLGMGKGGLCITYHVLRRVFSLRSPRQDRSTMLSCYVGML